MVTGGASAPSQNPAYRSTHRHPNNTRGQMCRARSDKRHFVPGDRVTPIRKNLRMGLRFKPKLTGKTLRWVVVLTLHDSDTALTVAEIVERVQERFVNPGRAGKAVSDSLRWEVRRGRVRLIQRGLYGAGLMPRSTEYGLRKRVETMELSLVATSAAQFDAVVDLADDERVDPSRRTATSTSTGSPMPKSTDALVS
jgi:hypothetical protein